MVLSTLLTDKDLKAKAKVESISRMLLSGDITIAEVIEAARSAKAPVRGTCIEAIEFATKAKPELASLDCLKFVTGNLSDKAQRVRWESAKVIANIARLYPDELDDAVCGLLNNSEAPGTVVRWSAALALREIVKLRNKRYHELVPAIKAILRREDDNAIKKIYQSAIEQAAADGR